MASVIREFTAFLQTLSSLPPSANRFDAIAEWVVQRADILNRPSWPVAKVGCWISWPLWLLVIVVSIEILIARRAWHASLWVTNIRGLIRLNAGNWMALFAIFYGVVTLVEVTTELTIPPDAIGHSSATWYAWEAAQFIPFYCLGVVYYMSISGSCLLISDNGCNRTPAEPGQRRIFVREYGWLAMAWFVNITGIMMGLAAIISITILVVLSHHYAVPFRDAALVSISNLQAAAPTYSPSTFSVAQVIPLVAPVSTEAQNGLNALYYLKMVWVAWLVLIALLSAVFTPFSTYHLLVLRKAAKTRNDLSTRSSRTGPRSWYTSMVRWVEKLNSYHVLLAQILVYHAIIIIHVGLCAWLVVLTSQGRGSQIVPVVGRYVGQMPFAIVYICATLFNRYQLAQRNAAIAPVQTAIASGIRVTQIVTQRTASPVSSVILAAATKSNTSLSGGFRRCGETFSLRSPMMKASETEGTALEGESPATTPEKDIDPPLSPVDVSY